MSLVPKSNPDPIGSASQVSINPDLYSRLVARDAISATADDASTRIAVYHITKPAWRGVSTHPSLGLEPHFDVGDEVAVDDWNHAMPAPFLPPMLAVKRGANICIDGPGGQPIFSQVPNVPDVMRASEVRMPPEVDELFTWSAQLAHSPMDYLKGPTRHGQDRTVAAGGMSTSGESSGDGAITFRSGHAPTCTAFVKIPFRVPGWDEVGEHELVFGKRGTPNPSCDRTGHGELASQQQSQNIRAYKSDWAEVSGHHFDLVVLPEDAKAALEAISALESGHSNTSSLIVLPDSYEFDDTWYPREMEDAPLSAPLERHILHSANSADRAPVPWNETSQGDGLLLLHGPLGFDRSGGKYKLLLDHHSLDLHEPGSPSMIKDLMDMSTARSIRSGGTFYPTSVPSLLARPGDTGPLLARTPQGYREVHVTYAPVVSDSTGREVCE